MNSGAEVELASIIHAQAEMLRRLAGAIADAEASLSDANAQATELRALEALMTEIEGQAAELPPNALLAYDADAIQAIYVEHVGRVGGTVPIVRYHDWSSFVVSCQAYAVENGLDPLGGYDSLLTDGDLLRLRGESYAAQYAWDKWDYIFVGASGLLAALTDHLLVGIPKGMPAYSKFVGQKGSPITAWLKSTDTSTSDGWFSKWTRELERRCKVPYDAQQFLTGASIPGMGGRSHRFQTLGHDPVLGFVLGVLDIMRGSVTGFSYKTLEQSHTFFSAATGADPVPFISAILRQLGHLISDVGTPAGLPSPLMPLAQFLNVGSFGEGQRTLAELSRYMYRNGYDLRHFITMGITPAVIEIILRAYIMLRHYFETGEFMVSVASHPKYRAMLLSAHAIAALGNAGKIWLMQGNPLAFNQAQWMALFRYLVPWMKYRLFDRQRLEIEHIERINDAGWNTLLDSTRGLAMGASAQLDDLRLG